MAETQEAGAPGAAPRGAASLARRALLHPLLIAPVLFAGSLPLLGTEHDFWGFLLALLAGLLGAVAIVGVVAMVRPKPLSVVLHVLLGAALGLLLLALGRWAGPAGDLPEAVLRARLALGYAAAPAAGWMWLSLIGRVTGVVQDHSARRAARLIEPEWQRDASGWSLELRVVPLRRSTFIGIVGVLGALGAGVLSAFVVVFDDLAQRMSPMVMLFVLGWTIGLPAYLVLRAVARSRTVAVLLRIDDERMRVLRLDGGAAPDAAARSLLDAPLAGLRRLRWSARSALTRIEVQQSDGESVVLLVGMAKRPKGESPGLPPLPPRLLRALESAGLPARASKRPRDEELLLERRD